MSQKKNNFKTFYALSIAWQLGFLVAIPIGISLFLGIWIDKFLGTTPLFLLLSLLIGVTVTIYDIYHALEPFIKKNKDKHD